MVPVMGGRSVHPTILCSQTRYRLCYVAWYSYKFNQKTLLLTVTLQTVKTQVKITTDCGILSACIHLAKIQTNFQGMKKFGTPTLIIGTIVFFPYFNLFVSLLNKTLYIPVNNFSVMLGRVFLVIGYIL